MDAGERRCIRMLTVSSRSDSFTQSPRLSKSRTRIVLYRFCMGRVSALAIVSPS